MKAKLIRIFTILILCSASFAQTPVKNPDPAVKKLGGKFAEFNLDVNGTTLHCVRGGKGATIILIHGFPQDWSEFKKVMPRLSQNFDVIAVDTRGIGGSKATIGGYEAANQAKDIAELAEKLKLENYYVVGHDLGGIIAYPFARQFAEKSRGVMIMEAPLPGIEPWDEVISDPKLWHTNFNQVPELPEKLVMGKQAEYLGYFFNFIKGGITIEEKNHFINSYKTADQLRSGFDNYRAFPANEKFNAAQTAETNLPIILVGGEESFGALVPRFAESIRQKGCKNVRTEIIKNSRHYVADEQPEAVAALIEKYAAVK